MLLFIKVTTGQIPRQPYFKTSYVTVYHCTCNLLRFRRSNFKTSYVTVYRMKMVVLRSLIRYFKTSYVTVYQQQRGHSWSNFYISKHRMLLFIRAHEFCQKRLCRISKHRMLLFILSTALIAAGSFLISKHRMLLFINKCYETRILVVIFQNIVCYCLSQNAIHHMQT